MLKGNHRFACAVYRRSTPYVRIPTTLVGLIDASVSNRVAVNWAGLKNRIGAYHEPIHTVIDPRFLRSLPEAEIRNGIAEIIKITSCVDIATFSLIEKHGEDLISTKFFTTDRTATKEAQQIANVVIRECKLIFQRDSIQHKFLTTFVQQSRTSSGSKCPTRGKQT